MPSIQELREAKGWTQAELATRLGVAPRIVTSWETGQQIPSQSRLRDIAALFRVAPNDIIMRRDEAR